MQLKSKISVTCLLFVLSGNGIAETSNPSQKQLPPYWISIITDIGIAKFDENIIYGFYFSEVDPDNNMRADVKNPIGSRVNWDIGIGFGLPGVKFDLSLSSFSKSIPQIKMYHQFENGEIYYQSYKDKWSLRAVSVNSAYYYKRLYLGGGISFYHEENAVVMADSSYSGFSGYSSTFKEDFFGMNILVGYDYQIHKNFIIFTEACYSLVFDDGLLMAARPLGGVSYNHDVGYFKLSIGTRIIIPLTRR